MPLLVVAKRVPNRPRREGRRPRSGRFAGGVLPFSDQIFCDALRYAAILWGRSGAIKLRLEIAVSHFAKIPREYRAPASYALNRSNRWSKPRAASTPIVLLKNRSAKYEASGRGGQSGGLRKRSVNGVMREMKTLLIYVTGAVCLVFGVLTSGNWALSKYHSLRPTGAEAHTTAVASKAELAGEATDADNPFRRPVWIEPTKKYIYTPVQVVTVKPDPVPAVTMPKHQERTVAKPVRPRVVVNSGARRAVASAGQAQQLLILPLQHQAPN